MRTLDVYRLYSEGFQPSDFEELEPNLLMVTPIAQPKLSEGGLHLVEDDRFETLIFQVVKMGPCSRNPLNIAVGDVIAMRNGFVEPIQPGGALRIADMKYAFAIVQRAADVAAQAAAEQLEAEDAVRREAEAKADIERTRAELVAGQG